VSAVCATPLDDRDTTYRVDDHESGFTVTAYYSRYQFIPESEAVAAAGMSALLNIAYVIAESRGRKIEPVNEQRVRMSMGRNGISGTTSWSGSVRVFYKNG
jgi:hypothetical protein